MMLMSLSRSRNVCNFAVSFFVPVFDPLRLVDVIVILLAVFDLRRLIFSLLWFGSTAY